MMTTLKETQEAFSRPQIGVMMLIFGCLLFLGILILSISVGAAKIDFFTVWKSILSFDPSRKADQIITNIRLPRELGAAMVGAAFSISGAIMQGITRNPLADPELLGINSGALFALAILFAFFSGSNYLTAMLVSFLGAGMGAAMVFGISSFQRGGMTPLRITLAGAAVTALLQASAEGIGIYFKLSQHLAFWTVGGVSGTNWLQLKFVFPVVTIGIVIAILFSKRITLLSFGDEIAQGVGVNTVRTKIVLMIVVLALTGTAVSLVGMIAFVGLIIPHMIRFLVGTDYRWILPCSALYGSLFMVLADTLARTINAPYETPIGAIVSVVGIPFFLYLVRRGGQR